MLLEYRLFCARVCTRVETFEPVCCLRFPSARSQKLWFNYEDAMALFPMCQVGDMPKWTTCVERPDFKSWFNLRNATLGCHERAVVISGVELHPVGQKGPGPVYSTNLSPKVLR